MKTPWTSNRNRPVSDPTLTTPRWCHICGEQLAEGRLRLCGKEPCREEYVNQGKPYMDNKYDWLGNGGKQARKFMPV